MTGEQSPMRLPESFRSASRAPRKYGELLAVFSGVLLFAIAFFWRVALSDKLLLRRDMLRVILPLKIFWAERIRAGHLPDWYPYDALGQPFAGMVVSGSFHPGNLLFLAMPAGKALTWNALLCFPLLATGLWALLRRLKVSVQGCALGVVLGTFNGYAVCITNSLPYLQAMALVPWTVLAAMYFFERPSPARVTLAALTLALVLFAGDAEGFAVVCAATLPIALFVPSRLSTLARGAAWLSLVAVAALVGGPQLVAGVHAFAQSSAAHRDITEALGWSMHPLRLLEMLLGPLFGTGTLARNTSVTEVLLHSVFGGLWVESVHFGAVGLLLAVCGLATIRGRRLRTVAVAAVVAGLLLALGKYGALYEIVFRLVPLWRPFRYPEKLVPYCLLLLSVAAALGFDRARETEALGKWIRRGALALGLAVVVLALGEAQALIFSRLCQWLAGGALTLDTGVELHANFLKGCALSALGLLTTVWAIRAPRNSPRGWVVPGVCLLFAFVQGEPLYSATSPEVLTGKPSTVNWLLTHDGPPRLGGPRIYSVIQTRTLPSSTDVSFEDLSQASLFVGLEPMTPALYGIEAANAYLPAASTRVLALRQADAFLDRLAGLFGAAYVAANEADFRKAGGDTKLILVENEAFHVLLLSNPTARTRVQLRRPVCVASYEEALHRATDPTFDFDGQAIVECQKREQAASTSAPKPTGDSEVVAYAPERIELQSELAAPGVLFLADAYYSGWSATVDGNPAPILPTNVAGRGVLLDSGKHRIIFSYRTPGLLPALAVSLGVLVLGSAIGLGQARRRARSRGQRQAETAPASVP